MNKQLNVFETTMQKTNELLKKIGQYYGDEDKHRAYLALRAVLHTLRDRLTIEHAVQLGAQLPILVRGLYYEGWQPSKVPEKMHKEQFIEKVEKEFNIPAEIDTEKFIKAVLEAVTETIDPAEVEKIEKTLPEDIKRLFS